MKDQSDISESGAIIMEAVMIFPMVILTVILILTVGNAYYQRSRVESIIQTKAIEGAVYCADELLRIYVETGSVPVDVSKAPEIAPYKYIFTGDTRSIVQGTEDEIATEVGKIGSGYFKGMEVQNFLLKLDYSNFFVAQTVSANATYHINIPIKLFGSQFQLECTSHIEVPLSDSPEFIRNVDMVLDYLERTKLDENYQKMLEKVKSFF